MLWIIHIRIDVQTETCIYWMYNLYEFVLWNTLYVSYINKLCAFTWNKHYMSLHLYIKCLYVVCTDHNTYVYVFMYYIFNGFCVVITKDLNTTYENYECIKNIFKFFIIFCIFLYFILFFFFQLKLEIHFNFSIVFNLLSYF